MSRIHINMVILIARLTGVPFQEGFSAELKQNRLRKNTLVVLAGLVRKHLRRGSWGGGTYIYI